MSEKVFVEIVSLIGKEVDFTSSFGVNRGIIEIIEKDSEIIYSIVNSSGGGAKFEGMSGKVQIAYRMTGPNEYEEECFVFLPSIEAQHMYELRENSVFFFTQESIDSGRCSFVESHSQ